MPGGVNSPVRALTGVGDDSGPVTIASGRGGMVATADGRELVDYVHGWGSVIAGHAHPEVVDAVARAIRDGLGFGMSTTIEETYAGFLCDRAGVDMVRMVSSGTEAAMTALRLARGHTGRDVVVKFAGGYHGHTDSMLVDAGSGPLTLGRPSSAGVPAGAVADTKVLPYNDGETLRECFSELGDKIAAVIVEPVAGNMNLVVPDKEFIGAARELCDNHGSVLVSDEVMTGLRASHGLAMSDLHGVEPDIACLGKVIGGGLPAAACGGRRKILSRLAPEGDVYQAGTLAGNVIALTAGLATMRLLDEKAHRSLSDWCANLCLKLEGLAKEAGVPFRARSVGAMAGFYFRDGLPGTLDEVRSCDEGAFRAFFHAMLAGGVLLPPSMYEACFVGLGHGDRELELTTHAARKAFEGLAAE